MPGATLPNAVVSGEDSGADLGAGSNQLSPGSLPALQRPPKHDFVTIEKATIDTHDAIRVNVKITVFEIISIDQVKENFTAIFTIQLFYIDPSLTDFPMDVTYVVWDKDKRCVKTERGCIKATNWNHAPNQGDNDAREVTFVCADNSHLGIKPTQILSTTQPEWDRRGGFRPRLTLGSAIGRPEELEHVRLLEFCSPLGGHVFEKYKYQATFSEQMELKDMPFDKQVLKFTMYAEEPAWNMQFAPLKTSAWHDSKDKTKVNKQQKSLPTEWELDSNVELSSENEAVPAARVLVPAARVLAWKPRAFRSTVDVVIHIKRKPDFYLWNVVVVNFFITLVTVTAYACEPEDFASRAGILFTILLTSIGYKYITTTWLPVKSYLTNLDKYILLNFIFQLVVIFENFGAALLACRQIDDNDNDWKDGKYTGSYMGRGPPSHECLPDLENIERAFAAALYGLWIAFHLVFGVVYMFRWHERCLSSWDTVYKSNGIDVTKGILQDEGDEKRPYGLDPKEMMKFPRFPSPYLT